MARTSDPHAAAIKAWDTRGRAHPGTGSNPTQLRQDYFSRQGWEPASGPSRTFRIRREGGLGFGVSATEELARFTRDSGMELTQDDVADLAGAPPGSRVEIELDVPGWGGGAIGVHTDFPDHSGSSYRIIDITGRTISNQEMYVKSRGEGLGEAVFEGEVDAAAARGFKSIDVLAVGSPRAQQTNGYYTWARFGFESVDPVRGPDGNMMRLTDLMMQPGGAEWWKKNGRDFSGQFDLSPESRSMRIFAEYRRLKKESVERKRVEEETRKREEMRAATEEANRKVEESIRRSAEWMARYRKEHPNG